MNCSAFRAHQKTPHACWSLYELDVAATAAQLDAPTLVLHAHDDLRIPFIEGRRLAALIPNSRFVPLNSRNHILLKTEPAWKRFLIEVRSFLGVETGDQHLTLLMPANETQDLQIDTESSWGEISALFDQAAGLGPEERALLLKRVEDSDVRRQVETLLDSDNAASVAPELAKIVKDSILSFHRVDNLEGRTISRYRVLEKLGEGGMGTVYKARDDLLDRFVALKFLPAYLSAKPEVKNRFILEAKTAAGLDHPNICTVYEIGEGPVGQLFIAMACYEGETLRDRIDRGPLPLDQALAYTEQAAQGLAQAHAAGIVHRDIKPANLFITTRNQVKILDFGIAKVTNVNITKSGVLVGTLAYMSPEQCDGRATDNRTDMWSLGIVLFEMLTGKHPFSGQPGEISLYAIQHEAPLSLSRLRPEAPPAVGPILKRLLAKLPEQRYGAMEELIEDLRAVERDTTGDIVRGDRTQGNVAPTPQTGPEIRNQSAREFDSTAESGAFVGREQEMRRLASLLDNAIRGAGRIVFITGEAGLGKTTLTSEFLKQTTRMRNGIICSSGQGVEPYGSSEVYLTFLNAFGAVLNGPAKQGVMPALLSYAPAWSMQFTSAFTSTDVREQLRRETMGTTQERMLREMGDCLVALSAVAFGPAARGSALGRLAKH